MLRCGKQIPQAGQPQLLAQRTLLITCSVHQLSQMRTAEAGWAGLEWAAAIPGTVGGAIYMNAGASGSDMASVLRTVEYATADGDLQVSLCELRRP